MNINPLKGENLMAETYGYIRVSSTDQNESRQRIALERQAIPSDRIFMDKLSGKDFQRPQYHAENPCPTVYP